ncbi:hypothetical protein D0C36_07445 [Mucilaginibacter conchicola]|uniref:Addiction module protein n=1 Tax=Mucilaginibacter conchicola TaxID=2303333 RepID=A0A372NZQ9_9SPHI|nr:hypothetical protein [Mucilaginibacter conchicola]RFZ95354.1 hypothetical protein D0C36_07445 [Mucilaginibacter conchicola]
MVTINFSIDQLLEAVKHLTKVEKERLKVALTDDDFALSEEQKEIILQRQKDYSAGIMKAYSLTEAKAKLNYTE